MAFGETGVTSEHVPGPDTRSISDAVGANIRDFRKRRGWKPADLAEHCRFLGAETLTPAVIENIEHGRRRDGKRTRDITIDELVAIAQALSVPPSALMPELAEGPADTLVMFGLEETTEGLRTLLGRIEDMKARYGAH